MKTLLYQPFFRHGDIRHQITVRWQSSGQVTIVRSTTSKSKFVVTRVIDGEVDATETEMNEWCAEHVGADDFWFERHGYMFLVYFRTYADAIQFKLAFA